MNTHEFIIYPHENENANVLPINFFTISSHFNEPHIQRPQGQIEFDQILFVKDGTGVLKCNGKSYELKRGCAFFSGKNLPIEYYGTDNLVTAFLTVQGNIVDNLCTYYGCEDFLFSDSIDPSDYITTIEKIISEYYSKKRDAILSSLVYSFYVNFFEEVHKTDIDQISKVELYIEKNFTKKLTLSELAEAHEMSVSKLCHDFKKKYNYSVVEYILNLKLSYARNYMFMTPNSRTADVAYLCGFNDVGYFCRRYKKRYGKTPKEDKLSQKFVKN